MSKDWTQEELQAASAAMKAAGHLSYEEFCAKLADCEICAKSQIEKQTQADIMTVVEQEKHSKGR